MKKRIILAIIVLILAFSGMKLVKALTYNHATFDKPRNSKDWTFMVYLDGDNDLEDFGLWDFSEMAEVGSTDDINIVVQMDRIDGFAETYGGWTDCKRFYVTAGLTPTEENAVSSLGEIKHGRPC